MHLIDTRFCWERMYRHVQLSMLTLFIYLDGFGWAPSFFWLLKCQKCSPTPPFVSDLKRKWNRKFINLVQGFQMHTHQLKIDVTPFIFYPQFWHRLKLKSGNLMFFLIQTKKNEWRSFKCYVSIIWNLQSEHILANISPRSSNCLYVLTHYQGHIYRIVVRWHFINEHTIHSFCADSNDVWSSRNVIAIAHMIYTFWKTPRKPVNSTCIFERKNGIIITLKTCCVPSFE